MSDIDHVSLSFAIRDREIGRRAPAGFSPIRLPKVRDQVAAFMADPDSAVTRSSPQHQEDFALAVRHLRAADLYWVTADMSALAVAAGAQLDTIRWANDARPSGCGLIVFSGGVGMAGEHDGMPVDAMSWGPAPGGLAVTLFCGRWRLDEAVAARLSDAWPPLIVGKQDDLGGPGELPADALRAGSATVIRTLAAAWALMQQPTLSDVSPAPVDRALARSYARADRPPPEVSIVDLRHLYRPPVEDGDGDGRIYRHRWVVHGHWREQAHGPGRELRRRIYVPSYVKGPDGAPLLDRQRVDVWRR